MRFSPMSLQSVPPPTTYTLSPLSPTATLRFEPHRNAPGMPPDPSMNLLVGIQAPSSPQPHSMSQKHGKGMETKLGSMTQDMLHDTASMVPWPPSGIVPWSLSPMMPRSLSPMVPRPPGPMVPQPLAPMVPRPPTHGASTLPGSHDASAPGLHGASASGSPSPLVLGSHASSASSSHGALTLGLIHGNMSLAKTCDTCHDPLCMVTWAKPRHVTRATTLCAWCPRADPRHMMHATTPCIVPTSQPNIEKSCHDPLPSASS